MIVRYPDLPAVEGGLHAPRPLVFLLGGYEWSGDGAWYAHAARSLDRHAGAVVYGVGAGPSFVMWFAHWITRADFVLIWIGNEPHWSEFEVGWALGAFRGEEQAVRVGIAPERAELLAAVATFLQATQMHVPIHTELDPMLLAARGDLRAMR